ncbi:MAG TPA: flagellar motor switch protein FliG [Oligoflexus sp.]|uniref:flagellar motor switch protein FliG n=1 Tax=Oligoflexus sp. TaxID=1971216 RepID=UPI002D7E80CF|nr:flagellar motor switch protein FliG [Oligoflexus sp.]HET9237448.1 flagellar motor switch protein FliG [Oligoflexus sp.]
MAARKFNPSQKAAILMLSLGEDLAAEIFRSMSESEVRSVGTALKQLGRVEQVDIDAVVNEFLTVLNTKTTGLSKDTAAFAQKAIQLAFKGNKGEALSQQLGRGPVKMRSLEIADPPTMARILQNEHPQTIAMILAHATSDKASAILLQLHESLRTEIMIRLSKLEPIDPDVVADIDQHLLKEIERMGSIHQRKLGGSRKVAEILNHLDKDGLRLLEKIEERNPDLSEDIRQKMFTFDDLILIDSRGIQELVKVIPRGTLTLALRAATETIQKLFYKNMSERSAKMLADDIEALGPQKQSDILKAQREVLNEVRKLEENGRLVIDRDQKRQVS